MKKLITSYSFNAASKQITFSEDISLEGLLLITNVTTNQIIYNFASSGGTLAGRVLTLDYNTTSMSDSDNLQIFYDDALSPSTESMQESIHALIGNLKLLSQVLANPSYVDKTANQMRAQVTGTVTATVSSTSLVNIDSLPGRLLMYSTNLDAWYNGVRRLIS